MNPQLSALGNFGGTTQTMLPASNSMAIDKGQCVVSIPIDQRGVARPQGVACDIGAVERAPSDTNKVFLPIVIK